VRLRSVSFAIGVALITFSGRTYTQSIATISLESTVTSRAVKDGSWADPTTWDTPPTNNGRVLIPSGLVVTIDNHVLETPFWIRADGTLRFKPDVDTSIGFESLLCSHHGRIEVGTAAAPVTASAVLTVKALSGQPINWAYDPFELSRGIIAECKVEMHGQAKTEFVSVRTLPAMGASTLTLDQTPNGWKVGDVLDYTAPIYDQAETFTLKAIQGNVVTLDRPIKFTRKYPIDPVTGQTCTRCTLHLSNRTRNVKIQSDPIHAGNLKLQGHVMLMHQGGHRLYFVEVANMGRTSIEPMNDPIVNEDGSRDPQLMPLCGLVAENVRGRYSVHFHRAGPFSEQSIVHGVSVHNIRNSKNKFSYINHSSNVEFRNAIAANADGSAFMTEEGDEVGWFYNIMAVHSRGKEQGGTDHQPNDACTLKNYPRIFHMTRLQVGFQGAFFWPQGAGTPIDGGVGAGMFSTGTDVWTRPLNFRRNNTYRVMFPIALLPDGGAWTAPLQDYIAIEFPPSSVKNVQVYGVGTTRYSQKTCFSFKYHGFQIRAKFPQAPMSVFQGNFGWNCHNGMSTAYTGNVHIEDFEILHGDVSYPRALSRGLSLAAQGGNNNKLTNVAIKGFAVPLVNSLATPLEHVTVNGQPYQP